MKEIEVKILEIDLKEVLPKIKALGAELAEKGLTHAKAFDFPDDRMVKKGQYVRVRKIAGRIEVVFKNPVPGDGFKINEEIEFTIDDFDAACELFKRLGLKVFADFERYRATYKIGNAKVEFDKYADVPWFLEVEAPTEKEVEKIVNALGFDMHDKRITAEIITEHYDKSKHFRSFAERGVSPDYDSLFE
jgi:adenylate cyclase class 2